MTIPVRDLTRQERYAIRMAQKKSIPVSIATVNFVCEDNVGFLARSLSCFGGKALHVIGHIPAYADLRRLSGGMGKFVDIVQHRDPAALLNYVRKHDIHLISAELHEKAISIHDFVLDTNKTGGYMVVVGNETSGIPEEILLKSDAIVQIPMLGIGWCLNTSQTGNIMLYELAKRLS